MSKMQVPFKSLKLTFGLDPTDLPVRDTTGLKSIEMVFYIPNTHIRLTANVNPKTYRRALKTIEENPGNVVLAVQGTINEQWQVLKDAGLLAQVKTKKSEPPVPVVKPAVAINPAKIEKIEKAISGQPIITLKKAKHAYGIKS